MRLEFFSWIWIFECGAFYLCITPKIWSWPHVHFTHCCYFNVELGPFEIAVQR